MDSGIGGDGRAGDGRDRGPATAAKGKTKAPKLTGSITVSAAASLTEAFTKMGTDFQKVNKGTTVTFNFAASSTLATQIQGGAPADVFASADGTNMQKLISSGQVTADPIDFASNVLTIVVKPGNPKNVKSLADLANLDVVALCAPTVPCGKYAAQAFSNLGVTIPPEKTTLGADVKATLAAVATGDADAGVVYVTDAKSAGKTVQASQDPGIAERARGVPDRVDRGDAERVPRQRLDQVRDIGARTEDTEVVRIPASSAGRVSRGRRGVPLLAVALAVVATAFFVLPLVGLLQRAPWSSLWDDLTTPQAKEAIRLSVVCSLWSTALCVVFGVPLAWVLARTRFPGRSLVRALVVLPMVLPPVVGGVALLFTFQRNGGLLGEWLYDWFGLQFTFSTSGAVLAETFVAMPFLVITVEAGLRTMDQRYEDAAASLGAGRWTVFRRVTLPMIAPALYAGTALAWARGARRVRRHDHVRREHPGAHPNRAARRLPAPRDATRALRSRSSLVLLAVSIVVLVALRDHWFGGLRDARS